MAKLRILLADDHTFLLQACEKMLQTDFEIPGTFVDGRSLVDAAPKLKPDAIVLDVAMPLLNGLDAARELKKLIPSAKPFQ
jgi:DNA-binding NarL/FixJ family response regulator